MLPLGGRASERPDVVPVILQRLNGATADEARASDREHSHYSSHATGLGVAGLSAQWHAAEITSPIEAVSARGHHGAGTEASRSRCPAVTRYFLTRPLERRRVPCGLCRRAQKKRPFSVQLVPSSAPWRIATQVGPRSRRPPSGREREHDVVQQRPNTQSGHARAGSARDGRGPVLGPRV
jgi:hypothetical protein